jgi:hypothetical protein
MSRDLLTAGALQEIYQRSQMNSDASGADPHARDLTVLAQPAQRIDRDPELLRDLIRREKGPIVSNE